MLDFVETDAIDERFFDAPYYLTPAGAARRLRPASRSDEEAGRIGIAKVILREVQHLAAVEVIGDALVL